MRLRPHHLLCTQGYSGKGYSEEFVKNMDDIVQRLRSENETSIDIVYSTDDICSCCPDRLGTDLCRENEKVKQFDKKVADYFHLEEKTYIYQELTAYIRSQMTLEILADICSGCSWFPVSACKDMVSSSVESHTL